MAESERERKARERREFLEKAASDELNRKNRERQEAADYAAQRERDQRMDSSFDGEFKDLFGDWRADVEKNIDHLLNKAPTDAEVQAASKAIQEAKKAAQGGLLRSPNPQKAKKILRQNKTKINNANKKGKESRSWFGCAVLAVPLLGAVVGILYGAYEGASALASALF